MQKNGFDFQQYGRLLKSTNTLEKEKPEEQKEEKAHKSGVFISYCTVLRKIYCLVQEMKMMYSYKVCINEKS